MALRNIENAIGATFPVGRWRAPQARAGPGRPAGGQLGRRVRPGDLRRAPANALARAHRRRQRRVQGRRQHATRLSHHGRHGLPGALLQRGQGAADAPVCQQEAGVMPKFLQPPISSLSSMSAVTESECESSTTIPGGADARPLPSIGDTGFEPATARPQPTRSQQEKPIAQVSTRMLASTSRARVRWAFSSRTRRSASRSRTASKICSCASSERCRSFGEL
jgi:hypothetical protein